MFIRRGRRPEGMEKEAHDAWHRLDEKRNQTIAGCHGFHPDVQRGIALICCAHMKASELETLQRYMLNELQQLFEAELADIAEHGES